MQPIGPLSQNQAPTSSNNDLGDLIKHPEESKDPYDVWKRSPTSSNLNTLLTSVRPTMESAITRHAGKNASPVVKGRARVLTIKAIKSYDREKGELNSHILTQLQPLSRYSTHLVQPLKTSERKSRQARELQQVEDEFWDENGREPTDLELADQLGFSPKRIETIRTYMTPTVATTGFAGEDDPIVYQSDPLQVWTDYVYFDLDPIDKQIMDYKLGLHGKPILPTATLAKKLNISPSAISQRAARIQAKINEGLDQ